MKHFFQTLGDALMWFLIVLLTFFLASGIYQRFFSSTGYTGLFGISYAVVVSGSMTPEIMKGDAIIYMTQDAEDYVPGNIVVYIRDKGQSTEKLIVHRIIEADGDTIITKGDHNNAADDPILRSQIVGRVVWKLPYVGTVVEWLRTLPGILTIVGICLVSVVTSIILKTRKKKEIPVVGA